MAQRDCARTPDSKPLQVTAAFGRQVLPTLRGILDAQAVQIPHSGLYLPAQGVLELRCVFASMLETLDVLANSPWGRAGVYGVPQQVLEYLEAMPRIESDWLSRSTVYAMKELYHQVLAKAYKRCVASPADAACSAKARLLQAAPREAIRQLCGFIGDSVDDCGGVRPKELADVISCMEFAHDMVLNLEDSMDGETRAVPPGLLARVHGALERRNVLALRDEALEVIRSTFDAVVRVAVRQEQLALNFAA